MARITGISCTHVKGIEHLDIHCDFYPNKPNFLVAPNGSGKSSLATAFASLNSKRLKVQDTDRYNAEDWDDARLSVTFDNGETYRADAATNEMAGEIDVQVVRSGLYANMTNRRVGPRVLSQTKMSVEQCVLYEKAPKKASLGYSVTKERAKYAAEIGKGMTNLAELFGSLEFLSELLELGTAFNTTAGKRYAATINDFFKDIIPPVAGKDPAEAEARALESIATVKPLAAIKELIDTWLPDRGDVQGYLDAIQVNRFIEGKRPAIKDVCSYLRYCEVRHDVNEMLGALNRTRGEVVAHVEKGSLVVDFPDWADASNGEIDVLQLCSALFRARVKLGEKEKSLLVIDEVFDYLDDANLLVAQHLLLEMMGQFKKGGKSLYVVILTHLSPVYFKSYRFKKFHTSYIESAQGAVEVGFLSKLLRDRNRCQKEQPGIYAEVSSHYLHFSTVDTISNDAVSYIVSRGVPPELGESKPFREWMVARLAEYLDGGDVPVPEICCGIRIAVEWLCYDCLLTSADKDEYLKIDKGTERRLDFAEEHGVEVPESFHLLGSIYNSCMHLTGAPGELELVRRQLNNKIVRHMIAASLKKFGWVPLNGAARAATSDDAEAAQQLPAEYGAACAS